MIRGFLGFTLSIAIALTAAAPLAAQDPRAQARENFERGVARYDAGAFQEALTLFQEAYRLAPHPTVRVNIANCYEELNRPIEALFHFERFLEEGRDSPAAQRREVQAAIRRLEARVGRVTFRVSPDGALVRVDQTEIRRAPVLEAIRMTPGSHLVEVRMEGYQSVSREFMVEAGQPAEITIRLEPGSDDDPEPGPTIGGGTSEGGSSEGGTAGGSLEGGGAAEGGLELGPGGGSEGSGGDGVDDGGGGFHLEAPTIIAAAGTGALLIGTIITGVLALSANSAFEDAVVRSRDPLLSPADRDRAFQDGLDQKSSADTLALVTDILLIGTIVAAGATVLLYFLQGNGESSSASLRAVPVALPGGGGLVLGGTL